MRRLSGQVRVVVIEIPNHYSIDERSHVGRALLLGPEKGRTILNFGVFSDLSCEFDWFRVEGSYCAPNGINDSLLRFVNDILWNLAVLYGVSVLAEFFCNSRVRNLDTFRFCCLDYRFLGVIFLTSCVNLRFAYLY